MQFYNYKKIFCDPMYQMVLFSKQQCDQLIEYFETNIEDSLKSTINGNLMLKKSIRSSRSLFYTDNGVDFQDILKTAIDKTLEINNQTWRINIGNQLHGFQIVKYEVTDDHYDWHMDWNPDPMSCSRKITLVAQLSDPNSYEGCELILKCGNAEIYLGRDQGNCVIFPSFYLHKVTPLISGVRYSIVFWIEGDSFQ